MTPDADFPFAIPPGKPSPAAVYAPSPVYLTGEEWIRTTTFGNTASVTVTTRGRILRPDNTPTPFRDAQTPNSNRTANSSFTAVSEGWLLGVEVLATSGTPANGAVWALVELVRGNSANAEVLQALAWGYVTSRLPLAWPGGLYTNPLDGPGHLRTITGTTPGAGVEITETVPTGARWHLLAFAAGLTCSATVASRTPSLFIDDGVTGYQTFPQAGATPASTSSRYYWTQQTGIYLATLNGGTVQAFGQPIHLPAGHRITTFTTNFQVGDQWSAVRYLVREWMVAE